VSKKGSSAPDPYATAAAQTQSNQQTAAYNAALNRTNQYTPYGNSVYTQSGKDSTGAPIWSNTITLAPEAQAQLDNQLKQNDALSNIGFGLADQATASLANPVSTSGLPSLQYGANGGAITTSAPSAGALQSGVATSPITGSIGNAGHVQGQIAPTTVSTTGAVSSSPVQGQLNTSGVSAIPSSNDYATQIKQAQDASYSAATRYLDPQYTNAQNDLDAKLANQGVVQGSDAYNRAQTQFSNQKTQAYGAAQDSAVAAGNALQNQLFTQGLNANAQGMANAEAAGNFANSAQGQGFNQGLANANLANSLQSQQFTQNQAQATLANSAQAQRYGQASNNATFQNAAQQQQYEQGLGNASLANSAQAQQYSQGLSSAQFANTAQQQQYSQAAQNAALNNSTQAQALQQQAYLATLPLNELNALRSGTQITNPTFTTAPTSTAAGTDISGDIYKSYQLDQANSNNFFSGLASLGSSALGAAGQAGGFAALFSDRRLKRRVRRAGRTPVLRLPVYEYEYVWAPGERHAGVMADEAVRVIPHAVLRHPSGYRMVDYRAVA
jgi:hypothetical protein